MGVKQWASNSFFYFVCWGLICLAGIASAESSTVTFDNKSGEPAQVVLVGPTREFADVPNQKSATVSVAPGEYYPLVRYGTGPENYRYGRGDSFTVKQTATTVDVITMTLHGVSNGNYDIQDSSSLEFEDALARKRQESGKTPASTASEAPSGPNGGLQGRFVWPDNSAVEGCKVKLVSKMEEYEIPPFTGSNYTVKRWRIARDAVIKDTQVNETGAFACDGLAPGEWYLFFKAPGVSVKGRRWVELEDGWFYEDSTPPLVAFIYGAKPEPPTHTVLPGKSDRLPDFELVHLLTIEKSPVGLDDKGRTLRFTWPKSQTAGSSRITIRHEDYKGALSHPEYATHEIDANTYATAAGSPLYPGKHSYRVEIVSPNLRVLAESDWIPFEVDGDVFSCRVSLDESDPAGTTFRWEGSNQVKAIRVLSEAGTFNQIFAVNRLRLPATDSYKTWLCSPLNAQNQELVPGWTVNFWQQPPNTGK